MKPVFTIKKVPNLTEILTFLMVLSVFVTTKIQNFQGVFDFYWYYPLYVLVVIIGMVKLGLPFLLKQRWLLIVGVLFTLSLISFLIHPYSLFQLSKQIAGWLLFGYAWLVIFELQKDKKRILNVYFAIAIFAAFLTIPEQILHIAGIHLTPKKGGWLGLYRCFSIANEPFPLAMLLLPAIIFYLEKGLKMSGIEKLYLLLLLTALFFTFSGGGWLVLGIYFAVSIFSKTGFNRMFRIILFLLLAVSFLSYRGTKLRISETTNVFKHFPEITNAEVLNNTNTSSRAVYLNTVVAWKQFKQNPVLGGGLGSHGEAYEKFVLKPMAENDIETVHFNQYDGASGMIRWFSEMGIIGMFIMVLFFWKILKQRNKELILPALSFWTAFLIHAGNYFHNGSFMWMRESLEEEKHPESSL